MIADLVGGIAASPRARAALPYGAITLAIVLLLLSFDRTVGTFFAIPR